MELDTCDIHYKYLDVDHFLTTGGVIAHWWLCCVISLYRLFFFSIINVIHGRIYLLHVLN